MLPGDSATQDGVWHKYKVHVPEGKRGDWEVQRFTVSQEVAALFNLRQTLIAFQRGIRARGIEPGEYTRLLCNNHVIMSDTPAEILDHMPIISRAHGRVLINGLGLGLVVQACLEDPKVQHVCVVEISPDVIDLVAPYYSRRYPGDRLRIIQADALEITVPGHWDCIWHDIWSGICIDNLAEMDEIQRRYAPHCEWQGSWSRSVLELLLTSEGYSRISTTKPSKPKPKKEKR